MDERVHFASLVMASQLGLIRAEAVVAEADQRIIESENPDYWLIEVSMQEHAGELEALIASADERVYVEVLRLAYQAWADEKITDQKLSDCCKMLWQRAGYRSAWYSDLVWIDDEFDLVSQGVFRREDSLKKIMHAVEEILRKHAVAT
jgi:hypothetical protein